MKSNNHPKLFSGFLIVAIFISCGHVIYQTPTYQPPFMEVDSEWADTTLSQMSLAEKVGQLFIIVSDIPNVSHRTLKVIKDFQPGGILIKNVTKKSYLENIYNFRNAVNIPLLELSDQLTSFNNQCSDLPNYPNNASLSALNRPFLSKSLHRKLITDFKHYGINCSLSPNIHSFENNPTNYHHQQLPQNDVELISKAAEKIEALQNRNILAIANSFDFYIDTIPDSVLMKSGVLNQYKPLVISGLSGVLMDKKVFDGDSITHRLPEFYKVFLKNHLAFDGLILGSITEKVSLPELIYAGATSFLVSENGIAANILQLKDMIKDGLISEEVINVKVRKLLLAKKWLELDKKSYSRAVNYDNPNSNSIKIKAEELYTNELFEHSLVLANNPDTILPFVNVYGKQFKVISVGAKSLRTFHNSFFRYANFSSHLYRPKKNGKINALAFNPLIKGAFIIAIDNINLSEETHKEFIASINKINESSTVVVVNYGNPLNLRFLDATITAVQVFERNEITEELVPQLLFGAIAAKGKLPLDIADWMPKGKYISSPITRLKYTMPEEVGLQSTKLNQIEAIMESAIRRKATPGGQILIAKQGKIIYSRTFGFHTYEKIQRVEKTDLYDIASITKTAATTVAAMQLYEEEAIKLNSRLKDQMQLPEKASIKNILLKDLFIHKSGLQRNMPIAPYLSHRGFSGDCNQYFCRFSSDRHTLAVAKDFYLDPIYKDSIFRSVSQLPRNYRHRKYLYSDVNFYLIHQLLEEKMNASLDDYLKWNFYQPLGLRFLTYKPLDRFPADVIVPTQDDQFWRKNLVRGYVHDESAALLGGVGGNAGVFANAEDLAVLFQMLLNGGEYGGTKFLDKATIDYFTAAIHGNHRGLGFDKARYNYTASRSASRNSFGHSGFSGTCVWVDPDEELIYVFLSNRIHPNPRNNQIKTMKVRQRIHQVIYDAIKSSQSGGLMVNMAGE